MVLWARECRKRYARLVHLGLGTVSHVRRGVVTRIADEALAFAMSALYVGSKPTIAVSLNDICHSPCLADASAPSERIK
jgi:hypothetical protein